MNIKKTTNTINNKKIKVNFSGQSPSILKPEIHELPKDAFIPTKNGIQGKRVKVKDIKYPGPKQSEKAEYIYTPDTPQFDQIQDFTAIYNIINRSEKILNREIPWAFGKDKLEINPHVGVWENAFYARQNEGIKLFYFQDPKTKKIIRLASSNEIVSHEAGHALLDAIRPLYLQTFYPETGALHEAFGDINALINSASIKEVREKVIEQTNGDLSKHNLLSDTGEEFAKALEHEMQQREKLQDPFKNRHFKDTKTPYLRSLLNDFKYKSFSNMPPYLSSKADKNQIHAEIHSFSRILSGTLYSIYKDIYNQILDNLGENPTNAQKEKALEKATNEFAKLFLNAAEYSAPTLGSFKNFALTMLYADKKLNKGKFTKILEKNFKYRDILDGKDIENFFENNVRKLQDIKLSKDLATNFNLMSLKEQRQAKRLIDALTKEQLTALVDPNVRFLLENLNFSKFPLIKKYQTLYTQANKLAAKVLDKTYKFDELYQNKDGEKFILYKKTTNLPILEITSTGKGGQLTETEGALLVFDKNNNLIFKNIQTLDNQMKQDIFKNIKQMISRKRIKQENPYIKDQSADNNFYDGVITADGQLIKYPQID